MRASFSWRHPSEQAGFAAILPYTDVAFSIGAGCSAITGTERSPKEPDVPTVAESGLAGYRATVDPASLPPPARRSRSSTVSRPRRARRCCPTR
jgi:hypothetical protein